MHARYLGSRNRCLFTNVVTPARCWRTTLGCAAISTRPAHERSVSSPHLFVAARRRPLEADTAPLALFDRIVSGDDRARIDLPGLIAS